MKNDRPIRVSKYLAKYLRHSPHELGLTLQPGGWVSVDELLAAAERHGFPITYDQLVECVETNDKQRFAFDVSGELIRANQGHSVEVDLQLEEREPPETLYHGTVERFLSSILEEGLVRGKRHHVHLLNDLESLSARTDNLKEDWLAPSFPAIVLGGSTLHGKANQSGPCF